MIFIGSTQTAPSGAVAYVDFPDDSPGQYTWTNLDSFDKRSNTGSYRLYGSFTGGFDKDSNIQNYEFYVITKNGKKIDYTKDFRKNIKIFPGGGTTPFQKDYKGLKVIELAGGTFFVKHKGKKFSKASIKYIYYY
jgi:hypothetical protein